MRLSARICSQANVARKLNFRNYDAEQVEFMREACINVDENDRIIGSVSKEEAHISGSLILHRAFSVFSFTKQNKLLLQKRSEKKITFPNLWTNTCCSHPLHNENEMYGSIGAKRAAIRKLKQELGIESVEEKHFQLMGKYIYMAEMSNGPWGEYELDYALILRDVGVDECRINKNEVNDVKEVDYDELMRWIDEEPEKFTPWMKMFSRTTTFAKWWKLSRNNRQEDTGLYKLN